MKTSVLVTSGVRCTPFAPGRCFYHIATLRTGAVVLQESRVALAPCGSRDPAAERDLGRALHAVRPGTVLLQGGAVPGAKGLLAYSTLGCSRRRMFSSRSALASTAPGAWVMPQAALRAAGRGT